MKLLSGWYSDYIGKRKPFAVLGYFLTTIGMGSLFLASSTVLWSWEALGCHLSLGRGVRGAPRDAMLADFRPNPKIYGRVFGFHRAMDTIGAVAEQAVAFFLIRIMPERPIFLITLIPGTLLFSSIALLVKDVKRRGGEEARGQSAWPSPFFSFVF